MENLIKNLLIILNQILTYNKISLFIEDEEYCLRIYEWILKGDYNKLKNIVKDPHKHQKQLSEKFLKLQLESASKNNVRIISIIDKDYPQRLKYLYHPPIVLYTRGEMSLNCVLGVVGTRNATYYGRNAIRDIMPALVEADIWIASGLAYGIDYYAHKYCLDNEGHTIAVLGTGIDICYPPQNRALFERILQKNSCIISEYPIGYGPTKYSFLQRNRIISGISDAVLVVESKQVGGALSTANFALDQGKDVFCVPGPIFSPQSAGCNNLIKQGAIPVTGAEDILCSLGRGPLNNKEIHEQNKGAISITNKESEILQMIDKGIVLFDNINESLDIEIGQLYNLLFDLESKGYIQRQPGNKYIRIFN